MASGPQIGSPAPDFTLPGGVLTGDTFERRDHT
ncbi:peroxiredoxin, partial [Streptomyces sp. NPDC053705]